MLAFTIHTHAIQDLKKLAQTDPDGAGYILGLLQQIKADPRLLDALTTHDFECDQFEVGKWEAFYRRGYNLWRLKMWDEDFQLLPHRIIYAFLPVSAINSRPGYVVLAVAPRGWNYKEEDFLTKRIIDDYHNL